MRGSTPESYVSVVSCLGRTGHSRWYRCCVSQRRSGSVWSKEYVPALMGYVDRYGIDLKFQSTLVAVHGAGKPATFKEAAGEKPPPFHQIHVTPPQRDPGFLPDSPPPA